MKTETTPQLIIFMGVSGCGKSTIASQYASRHNMQFYDADDFHSVEAKAHMKKGLPLTTEMREPWIRHMVDSLSKKIINSKGCTLAYSGLIASQRQAFLAIEAKVHFIHLVLPVSEAIKRVTTRSTSNSHFFPSDLVQSQFDSLEARQPDEQIVEIDALLPIETILETSHNSAYDK